jgi:hypothetical protein
MRNLAWLGLAAARAANLESDGLSFKLQIIQRWPQVKTPTARPTTTTFFKVQTIGARFACRLASRSAALLLACSERHHRNKLEP